MRRQDSSSTGGQPSGAGATRTAAAPATAAASTAGLAYGAKVGMPTDASDEEDETPAAATDNGCHDGYGALKALTRTIVALSASGAHDAAIANLSHAAANLTSDMNGMNFSVVPWVQNVSASHEVAQPWQSRFSETCHPWSGN